MELLNRKIDILINKLNPTEKLELSEKLQNLISVYPFNKHEFIISKLLSSEVLSYYEYISLRNSYIERNIYLPLYEISGPRNFGETWAEKHLIEILPELIKPQKASGRYNLELIYNNEAIRIEVKATRAVKKEKGPLYEKAMYYSQVDDVDFLMNFQQIKPSLADIFIWIAVYRDRIRYWVLSSSDIISNRFFTPQHRNEKTSTKKNKEDIFEGQIMLNRKNFHDFDVYSVSIGRLYNSIIQSYTSL